MDHGGMNIWTRYLSTGFLDLVATHMTMIIHIDSNISRIDPQEQGHDQYNFDLNINHDRTRIEEVKTQYMT